MGKSIIAGLACGALVFAVGFVLGTLRVFVLEPAVGPAIAVLIELPVILIAAWLVVVGCVRMFSVPRAAGARLLMGAFALAALLALELAMTMVFGGSLSTFLEKLASLSGAIGLAGQILFAFFPSIQSRRGK